MSFLLYIVPKIHIQLSYALWLCEFTGHYVLIVTGFLVSPLREYALFVATDQLNVLVIAALR